MNRLLKAAVLTVLMSSATSIYAYSLPVQFFIQGGGYSGNLGQSQHVAIKGLIGDNFSVNASNDFSPIFGTGFLIKGLQIDRYGVDYGINAFYLAKAKVSGNIVQENVFTNLSYKYYVSHLPVYAFAKAYANTDFHAMTVTVDAGVGPNFMSTGLYTDSPRNSFTVPDNAYAGHFTSTELSGMIGVGLKKTVLGQIPIEIGYRYFYLGEGYLKPISSQITSKLKTGNISAQALMLTVSI